MRHEFNSKRLLGITRSKGKMFEFGLPENLHIEVPQGSNPEELFLLTIGTLGDVASKLAQADDLIDVSGREIEELSFSASFFDAFLESKFEQKLNKDTIILAASAYYLAGRPGSSLVMARQLDESVLEDSFDRLLAWILKSNWAERLQIQHPLWGQALQDIFNSISNHFASGINPQESISILKLLRIEIYKSGTPKELLFIDIITAVMRIRFNASAWETLPRFTGIDASQWGASINRSGFPKELWPSQMLLGKAGIFSGNSGVVQMPTSAGKTRSIEIVIRSAFLSNRTNLAVIVAPFRALCHEIGTTLRRDFKDDNIKVNELTDAIQLDFLNDIAELLGVFEPVSKYLLVVTPEKLLYVLRQTPTLLNSIGLVVYDEGHQFDSGNRGITYELLLTEIKSLLPQSAQTVLVSAVIQNAAEVGEWLIGEDVKVINGVSLLPTSRSVAFASWLERLGQLIFFESNEYTQADYFVPRVIEQIKFEKQPRQKKDRFFPEKNDPNDIALYLGLKLVPEGAVAIFCGRKDTATSFAKRVVEIYDLNLGIAPPAVVSNQEELRRLNVLFTENYGQNSVFTRSALLGVFVHHGATPQGIRLSIEYAMQKGLVKFVACTSTLAQGVNLPIRYLIVTSIYQGQEKIKVRDFQNLVGRAGRSGMHTEGLIIFADSDVYDKRRTERWKFDSSVQLLFPDRSELTTSSILEIFQPILSLDERSSLNLGADYLMSILLGGENSWGYFADEVIRLNQQVRFDKKQIIIDLARRRKYLHAIESHLMANRGADDFDEFRSAAEKLATQTLAFHLASEDVRKDIVVLFTRLAAYLNETESDIAKQIKYAKTLLGISDAKKVEHWVNENREQLLIASSNQEFLDLVWTLFPSLLSDKFFHVVDPSTLAYEIASKWISGLSYGEIYEHVGSVGGSKPYGENRRRQLTFEDVIEFCDNTLAFQCSLLLGAIAEFLFADEPIVGMDAAFKIFQKALKYGLPDTLSISIYEKGFSDRCVAIRVRDELIIRGYGDSYWGESAKIYYFDLLSVLDNYPSYFITVLDSI